MRKILVILTVLALISCSSRKVNKSTIEVKQETTSTIKDTISILSEKSETKVDTTSIIEECYEPIDSTKEMIINGKIYKNLRFKTSKTKNGITIAKKEDSSLNQSKTIENKTTIQIKEDTKDIYKEPAFNWWIFILIAAIITYIEYNRE